MALCCLRRYEGRIVQQLIRNDGGSGDFDEITPTKLGIWSTILKVQPHKLASESLLLHVACRQMTFA